MAQHCYVPVHMPNSLAGDPTNCVGGIKSLKATLSAREAVCQLKGAVMDEPTVMEPQIPQRKRRVCKWDGCEEEGTQVYVSSGRNDLAGVYCQKHADEAWDLDED